jgi:hypothetical protein
MAHTPWGELAVADAHVHFFSNRFYAALAAQKGLAGPEALAPLLDWEIPPATNAVLAERWVAELDRYGVARAALIASIPGDETSVAEAVAVTPGRFYGYFMVDPTQADAADRVAHAGADRRMRCMCLFPAMHSYSVADPKWRPVFEAAACHKMAVFVHCGALSVGVRKKLGLPSLFDMRYSNPLDLHPVASRFPALRFIVPHFGAGLFREALMLADLCPNVWLDTSSGNRWMAYEHLDLRSVFRRALDLLGPGRLVFGTDSSFFPRGWNAAIFEQQTTALYELGLNKDQAEQILCRNLEQIFAV